MCKTSAPWHSCWLAPICAPFCPIMGERAKMSIVKAYFGWQCAIVYLLLYRIGCAGSSSGQLVGVPSTTTDVYEASVYTYYLKLSRRPYSSSIPSVFVDLDIVHDGGTNMKPSFCALLQNSVRQFSLKRGIPPYQSR